VEAVIDKYGERVAVIGAGPGGLAAARYLKARGFEPVIYEQSERLGGQWNAGAEHSGVWPGMRANTSRVVMRFSDLDYPAETGAFPTADEVLAYLERYAEAFALRQHLRLGTKVETLARHPAGGWVVHSRRAGSVPRTEIFQRVVVATGRYGKPTRPEIPGLDSFTGCAGVCIASTIRARRLSEARKCSSPAAASARWRSLPISPDPAQPGWSRRCGGSATSSSGSSAACRRTTSP
jgi:glycine/D-amino acid oxidase-like deaminating enzyme